QLPQLHPVSRSRLPYGVLPVYSRSFLVQFAIVLKILDALFQSRRVNNLPVTAFIPWTERIRFAFVTHARRVVEILIDQHRCRSDLTSHKRILAHAFQRRG